MPRSAERLACRVGPVPSSALTNSTTMTAAAQRAFLSAGTEQGRRGGVVSGRAPEATPDPQTWYRLENMAGAEPTLYLYGEVGCWGITASDLIEELRYVTNPTMTVHLNSPGGEIFEGIAIYNALRSHPAAVTIRVDGIAASIASVILQAGDQRVMQPFSQTMIHEGSGLCWGDAADMTAMATLLDAQSDNIAGVYAERAGGTPESWREAMRTETWYSAEEAVAAGLADVVDAPVPAEDPAAPAAPAPAVKAMWDLSGYKHAGRSEAPAPILNAATQPAETEPPAAPVVDGEPAEVPDQVAEPLTPETPDVPAEPVAAVEPPDTTPVVEPPASDPWADLTALLLTVPTWDDVTASLKGGTK